MDSSLSRRLSNKPTHSSSTRSSSTRSSSNHSSSTHSSTNHSSSTHSSSIHPCSTKPTLLRNSHLLASSNKGSILALTNHELIYPTHPINHSNSRRTRRPKRFPHSSPSYTSPLSSSSRDHLSLSRSSSIQRQCVYQKSQWSTTTSQMATQTATTMKRIRTSVSSLQWRLRGCNSVSRNEVSCSVVLSMVTTQIRASVVEVVFSANDTDNLF